MASLIIPVALCAFLGPGIGQLYNKDYKKGVILIAISLVVVVVLGIWYVQALKPYIPTNLENIDPLAMQEIVKNATSQMTAKQNYFLSGAEAILMVLWIYGIVDAYRVASKRQPAQKQ